MYFLPYTKGSIELEAVPHDFAERISARVGDGLFNPGSRLRAQYSVRNADEQSVTFGADTWFTAINVGLNEVTLYREGDSTIAYAVQFRRWTLYCVGLCGMIGLAFIGCYLLVPSMRLEIQRSTGNALVFWTMTLFWGFVWPWILTALHKGPAGACLEGIVREVCTG
jgi:hypothetical protein